MRSLALLAALALTAEVPAHAEDATVAPLAERLAETASRFCVDILSQTVAVPGPGSPVYARYGLIEGAPNEAIDALGRDGLNLISGATLASGVAANGRFVVALGGAAGENCRVIAYGVPAEGTTDMQVAERMTAAQAGWRSIPSRPASPAARKLSFLKRDAAKRPYLANLLSPTVSGPIRMVITVVAIPANVTLPEGY